MSTAVNKLLLLGTATPGGGFPVYGEAYAAAINEVDPALVVRPAKTKGSTQNVELLESGKIDLAQVSGEVFHEAITGVGRARTDLRIISAMYSSSGMFVVRADSPYKTIDDLRKKPVAWGAAGSGFIVFARYVMDGLGLNMNEDFQPRLLDKAGDGPAMVLDGRVAALWGGGVGWPGFMAVANGGGGARFIAPDTEEIERITAKHAFIKPMILPADSYPHQPLDVPTVGSWSLVVARPDLPDDVAYRLAYALHTGSASLAARLEQARESTLANTLAAAPNIGLIHPGVQKYMRVVGLLK